MTGSRSTTCSPSTVRTMRKTPWVAGCWGPTLTLRSIVSSSRSWGGRYSVAIPLAALLLGGQRLQRLRSDAVGGGMLGTDVDVEIYRLQLTLVGRAVFRGHPLSRPSPRRPAPSAPPI